MFKLIRVDSTSPSKVLLPVGSHIFGRGLFLDIDAKELRVSKTHGRFEVTKDGVSVVSTHVNPCFIQKVGSAQKIILNHNNSFSLEHGDKVGLLPDSFWYELVHVAEDLNAVNSVNDHEANGQDIKSCNEDKEHTTGTEEENNVIDIALQQDDNNQVPDSPSLLENNSDQETTVTAGISTVPQQPLKRSHSLPEPDNDESHSKVIKTEPVDEPSAKSQEPGTSAQSVTTESSTKDASTSADADSTSNTPQAHNIAKERCIYGASCYRRNPQHKAQFAHPGEAAWGAGARGVCPWGAGCRRRDPRHWRDHDHPPGTQRPHPAPPQPHQPGNRRVVYRNGNIFYVNAHTVNFYDDHFNVEDSDGDSVDFDYEF